MTANVDGRLAALKSSTPINGFQLPLFTVPISEATASGMVSSKITGFPIPESRPKSRSPERNKWLLIGALNGRFETGSGTERVGSGLNGRRRSGAWFQNAR